MRRRVTALSACVGAVAAFACVANAQSSHVVGEWGGGTALDPPASPYGPGNLVITLSSAGSGTVDFQARVGASCELPTISGSFQPSADGAFSVAGSTVARKADGRRVSVIYSVAGTIDDVSATGSLQARIKITRPHRKTRRCETGPVEWTAHQRRVGIDIGAPAAVQPSARLYGTTKQYMSVGHHPILLRVSADGSRLARALYSADFRCGSDRTQILDTPHDDLPIRADGTFSDVEHFTVKLNRRTRARFTDRFSGTIGSAGATGSFKLTGKIIDIPSGHTFERCKNGTVKWTALP
jgi:hypothetical protein